MNIYEPITLRRTLGKRGSFDTPSKSKNKIFFASHKSTETSSKSIQNFNCSFFFSDRQFAIFWPQNSFQLFTINILKNAWTAQFYTLSTNKSVKYLNLIWTKNVLTYFSRTGKLCFTISKFCFNISRKYFSLQ